MRKGPLGAAFPPKWRIGIVQSLGHALELRTCGTAGVVEDVRPALKTLLFEACRWYCGRCTPSANV